MLKWLYDLLPWNHHLRLPGSAETPKPEPELTPLQLAADELVQREFPYERITVQTISGLRPSATPAPLLRENRVRVSRYHDGVWLAELVQGEDCIYRVRMEPYEPPLLGRVVGLGHHLELAFDYEAYYAENGPEGMVLHSFEARQARRKAAIKAAQWDEVRRRAMDDEEAELMDEMLSSLPDDPLAFRDPNVEPEPDLKPDDTPEEFDYEAFYAKNEESLAESKRVLSLQHGDTPEEGTP